MSEESERRQDSITTLAVAMGRVETNTENMIKSVQELKGQLSNFELRLRKVEDDSLTFKGAVWLVSSYTAAIFAGLKFLGVKFTFGG